jgi:cysteine synthase A
LKSQDPEIACYLVEPSGAAVMAGEELTNLSHRIQGGGYALPELSGIDRTLVDGFVQVTDNSAIDASRRLARLEGIFAGFSAGACIAAAEQLRQERPNATYGIVLADSGMKYLSTDLWG